MELKPTDRHLLKSARVEVSSNEDGYRGAWFAATILDPDPPNASTAKRRRSLSKNSKLLVQYDCLLRDDVTREPLTELVKAGFIRPSPPADHAGRSFEVGDFVDAFNLDAWWPGVVVNVEGEKYTVGFRDPPDLLVLRRPEVRPHWDFKNGLWARAQKLERVKGYEFSHGTAIEVNLNKEVLLCAWFPATYLGQLGINSHLVQCKSSEGLDIKVVVESHQFRPQPPNLPARGFNLLETVDAFHDMGWYVGGITKVLREEHYMVRLKYTRQEKECSHLEMRPHLDWLDGRWVTKKNRKYVPIFEEVQIGKDYEQFGTDYVLRSKRECDIFRNSEEKTASSRISWKNQANYLSPCNDASPSGKTKKRLKMSQQANDDASCLSVCKNLNWGNSVDSFTFSEVYARRTPFETSNQKAPDREAENSEQLQSRKLKISIRKKVEAMKGRKTTKAGQEDVEDEPVMDNRSVSEVIAASHVGTSGLIPMEEVEQQNEDEPRSVIKGKGQLSQLLDECSKDPETACGHEEDNGAGPVSVDCMFELPAITKLDLIGEKPNDIGVAAEVELTQTKALEDSADALVVAETVDSAVDNMTKEDQVALPFFIVETLSPNTIEESSNLASTANQQNEANGIQVQIDVTGSQDAVREVETMDAMDYSTEEVGVAVAGISVKTVVHDQPFSLHADEMNSAKAIESLSSQDPVKTVDAMNYSLEEAEVAVAGLFVKTVVHDQPIALCGYQTDSVKAIGSSMKEAETVDAMDYSTKEVEVAVAGISVKTVVHDQPFSLCADEMNSVKAIESSSSQDPVREVETVDAMDYSTEEAEVAVAELSVKTVVHDQPIALCGDQTDSVKAIGSSNAVKEAETVDAMDYSTKEVEVAVAGISVKTVVHDQPFSLCADEMNSVKAIESSSSQDPVREVETVDAMDYSTEEAEVAVAELSVKTVVHDQPFALCADQMNSVKAIESLIKESETVDTMDYSTKEVEVAVTGMSIKAVTHDQPFPVCADEMNPVKAIESSSKSTGTANQHNENRGTQVEAGVTVNVQQQNSPHLPFVKNYLQIWEKIESMDAFKRYPQSPHFQPLVTCEELDRESIAIAKMLRFAALVDKIPKLQVEDSRDFFHSNLKTLGELETFGFDVKEVRSFLNSLLETRVKLEELLDQSKELELEVVKRTHDRSINNEEICVVDKEIKDLQETLKVLEEKRAVLMSMDVTKGSEISRLESESSDITKSIRSVMRVFEEQVSAF